MFHVSRHGSVRRQEVGGRSLCRAVPGDVLMPELATGEPVKVSSTPKGPVLTGCACSTAPWHGLAGSGMTSGSERQAGRTGCHPTMSKCGWDPASGNDVLPQMAGTVFITSFN